MGHFRTETHSLTEALLQAVGIAPWHPAPFRGVKFGASVACRNEELWALKPHASAASSAPDLGCFFRDFAQGTLVVQSITVFFDGIISRVTELVKNIVQGWLQKFFNKSEDDCVETNEEENPANCHYDYANEDTLVTDGRVMPESARVNLEASTGGSALNFSDVLTRSSLSRSHLNCSVLDSTLPHCQPSTSSSLGIGRPGLSLVKEIKGSTSQHDAGNISKTSGFSSRASGKDIRVSTNTSAPRLWSTGVERARSLSQHPTACSKKPAFSLSSLGSPSPSLGSTSILKTSQLGDSPFYSGKTRYGGAAAAARETKARIAQPPVRRQMTAKPASVQSYGVISSEAQRVLQSLEQMSSPVAMESRHLPVQKFATLTLPVSRIKSFKPSLNPATVCKKNHQRVAEKQQDMREKSFPAEQQGAPSESDLTCPELSTPVSKSLSAGGGKGGSGKIRKRRRLRCKSNPGQEQQELAEPVLPEVPLPISAASLPSFSFGFPGSSAVSSPPSAVSAAATDKNLKNLSQHTGFTFRIPDVKAAELSASSDTAVTSFRTLGSVFPSGNNTCNFNFSVNPGVLTGGANPPAPAAPPTATDPSGFSFRLPPARTEGDLTCPEVSAPVSESLSAGGGDCGSGKMREERELRCKSNPGQEQQELAEPVLPEVPLPTSAASLPSVSFGLPDSSAVSSPPSAVSAAATDKDMREKSFPTEQQGEPSESDLTCPELSTPVSKSLSAGGGKGGSGKIRKRRRLRCKSNPGQEQQELAEPVLPEVPLPISAASLPSFSFGFPGSSAVSSPPSAVSAAATDKNLKNLSPHTGFTFRIPDVKAAELSASSDTAVTSFRTLGSVFPSGNNTCNFNFSVNPGVLTGGANPPAPAAPPTATDPSGFSFRLPPARTEGDLTCPEVSAPVSESLSAGGGDCGSGKMREERELRCKSNPGQEQQWSEYRDLITSSNQKVDIDELAEPVLPEVPLPISAASLPSFSFGFPGSSAVSSPPSAVSAAATDKANLCGTSWILKLCL
ncbi:uncharacterized protein O3Q21_007690 [Podargus strigoides]